MKLKKLLATLVLASSVATLSSAASYIKIEGIEGESKSEHHKGWIDIESISGLSAPRDAASGMATGKHQHKPITLTKQVDKSSPLFQASVGSGHNPLHEAKSKKANNPLHEANGTSANNPLFASAMTIEQDGVTYQLHGVKVLSSTRDGDTETITLSYTSINILPKAAELKPIESKAVKATDYNSSRSNKNGK